MGFVLGLPWELGSQLAEDRSDPSLAQSSSAGTAHTAAGSWGLSSIPHISELKDKGNMPLTLFPPLHQEGVVIWQLYSSYPSPEGCSGYSRGVPDSFFHHSIATHIRHKLHLTPQSLGLGDAHLCISFSVTQEHTEVDPLPRADTANS